MLKLVVTKAFLFQDVIAEICDLNWAALSEAEMITVAWAYYFFSVQFRENLELACVLFPEDANLAHLKTVECDTDNLSPYPGVAAAGESLNHDEFMRRLLALSPIADDRRNRFGQAGARYLQEIRGMDPMARALSIASFEDGGLERVFTAMLRAPAYPNPALQAFRFFLSEHIRFDSDPDNGHGSLSRHLAPDESVFDVWVAFKELLVEFTPALSADAAKLRLRQGKFANGVRAK